ncbi:hypothetical protein SAMN04490244_101281 [Tranquillimonas rosea]|uniref:Uncharacterized protein n=1 Tax=Tranquillimonas rosea TaxID=641238 RepID=A0A1H9PPT6_9RHOB|nr:hypothetical protein [Tranquillimonas rosea]SER50214.1 hypothetical protein SAMN04490244_101281 [Tranquillimonas rosea]
MKMRDRMEPVIFVDTKGRARLSQTVEGVALDTSVSPAERRAAQEAALRVMMSQNAAPEECGPAIVRHAPARGQTVPFAESRVHRKADGTDEVRDAMWQGRQGMRRADVFDRMAQAAGKKGAAPSFSDDQVAMGRRYRDLTERHASAGIRGMSLETLSDGGGGGDFITAVLRDREQLTKLHRRIGNGVALEVRRVRPSSRRRAIPDRHLVDMVCIHDKTIADVLQANGWDAKDTGNRDALRRALAGALDRMIGPVHRPRRHVFIGEMPGAFWPSKEDD